MNQTFEFNGARLTVRRATVRDRLAFNRYYMALMPYADDDGLHDAASFYQVAQIFAMTEGDIGLEIPSPGATAEEVIAAYEAFLNQDADLFDKLVEAIRAINGPLSDGVEAATPPADPKD